MNNTWCITHAAHCFRAYPGTGYGVNCSKEEPLAQWEKDLLRGPHAEGYGDVTFVRFDGRTVVVENVRVDSICDDGTGSVIGAECDGGTIVHVPYVSHWTVEYIV